MSVLKPGKKCHCQQSVNSCQIFNVSNILKQRTEGFYRPRQTPSVAVSSKILAVMQCYFNDGRRNPVSETYLSFV